MAQDQQRAPSWRVARSVLTRSQSPRGHAHTGRLCKRRMRVRVRKQTVARPCRWFWLGVVEFAAASAQSRLHNGPDSGTRRTRKACSGGDLLELSACRGHFRASELRGTRPVPSSHALRSPARGPKVFQDPLARDVNSSPMVATLYELSQAARKFSAGKRQGFFQGGPL